jgi:branched-subunit amino acid transport protein
MILWVTVMGMGLITFGLRLGPVELLERFPLNDGLRQALRFVPAAVLSAIIWPELLQPGGVLDLSWGNERLLAGLGAVVVAVYSRSVLWTIGAGMVVLWLLQYLLAGV